MLRVAAAILLCLLPSQVLVNGLIRANAKCLAGYDWTFSSIGQSPCDVAAELASVCLSRPYNLDPLPAGRVYSGPYLANQTSCVCNSVSYSLLSAYAYCQGREYIRWSIYYTNCTVIFLTIYTQQIPVGVNVPAYAYQDVSISNTFNVTLAQSTRGIESTRTPSTRTPSTSTQIPTTGGNGNIRTVVDDTPSIVGGVVGGVVALGLIAALITYIILHSKHQRPRSQSRNMAFIPDTTASRIRPTMSPPPGSPLQQSRNKASIPDTPASLVRSTMSLPPGSPRQQSRNKAYISDTQASLIRSTMSSPPGSPGRVHKTTRNHRRTNPSADPDTKDTNRQHSPPLNQSTTPDATKTTAQNDVPPQMPENAGGPSDDTAKSEL